MPRFSSLRETAIDEVMDARFNSPLGKLALILGGLLALRLIALFTLPWGLHGDEAQYWAWSQDPDFGYFSKPPMIAWVIGTTTGIFGNAEWAVRLAAPFLHIATSLMIFLTGRKLWSAEIGFWAALIYILMPAVWLSSYIMSTDVSLLLCWAVALHAWVCLRDGGGWGPVLQLGLALGFGLLSKYAMAFMIPVLGAAILFDPQSRKAILNVRGLCVAALAIGLLIPNLMWNAAHEFATLSHTAENANLGRDLFNPSEVLRFWVDQFGVFGFVPFPMLLIAIVAAYRGALTPPAKWIAALAALPLIVISIEAVLSRANANWAVTAYVAAPLLVALWAAQTKQSRVWLKWGLAAQTAFVLLLGGLASSERFVDQAGLNNAVKRMRAWPETSSAVLKRATEDSYAFIAADNRLVFYDLNYYQPRLDLRSMKISYRSEPPQLKMWSLNASPAHHANMTQFLPNTDAPVLIISYHHNFEAYFHEDFETLTPLKPITIDLGPGKVRHLKLWRGTGYRRTTREDRR